MTLAPGRRVTRLCKVPQALLRRAPAGRRHKAQALRPATFPSTWKAWGRCWNPGARSHLPNLGVGLMSAHASGGFRSNQQHRVARATATGEERHYGLLRRLFAVRHMRLVNSAGGSAHIPGPRSRCCAAQFRPQCQRLRNGRNHEGSLQKVWEGAGGRAGGGGGSGRWASCRGPGGRGGFGR